MARSFPPDVIVLDTDGLIHARLGRGKGKPALVRTKAYRLPDGTFTSSVVSPQLANEQALADALRRVRADSGRWDKVSLLLPDSWFRINIVDLPALPERPAEALETVRWSLKRTLPIPPEQLRVTYSVLSHEGANWRLLVLSAMDATLSAIERVFAAAGFDPILIEPTGINIWNAIAVREPETAGDRLFLYVRDTDFTTAVFRGAQPLFIRSRNISGDRTIDQEIRLSANYLRDSLAVSSFAACFVAGAAGGAVHEILSSEFDTKVKSVDLRDYAENVPAEAAGIEAELTACTGVFTG